MVSKGNHPQMAARFRLVKYYNLPRLNEWVQKTAIINGDCELGFWIYDDFLETNHGDGIICLFKWWIYDWLFIVKVFWLNKIVDVPETLLDRWLDQEGLPYAPVQYSPDHLQGEDTSTIHWIAGWWFQTFIYFPFHIWDVILPID